jgi:hypothetical protein
VDHVWELSHTHFDYYYFNENCSYHLLSVLEVVRPSLNLTDTYQVYTIPADTIRLLKSHNLIEEGKRRESTYSRLRRFSRNLNNSDLELAKEIALAPESTSKKISNVSTESAAKILDVSIEAFDYYNVEQILKDEVSARERKSHILLARANNPVISDFSKTQTENSMESPALSHAPTRLSISESYSNGLGKNSRFEFRAALHDLLDPSAGSLKEAQLELGKFSFDLQEKRYRDPRIIFNEFSLINIKNYQEQNFWASPISWEIDIGGKEINRWRCMGCPGGYISGSIGNSLQFTKKRFLLSLLFNGELNIQSQFINNYRVGVGPKLFTRLFLSDYWVAAYTSTYHLNTVDHKNLSQDQVWLNEFETRHHYSEKISLFLRAKGIEIAKEWYLTTELGLQYFYE